VKKVIRSIAVLLLSACLMQGAWAQFNVSGPGFLPDENGTNLDDPQAKKGTSKVAAGSVIKDCAECPEMVVIPAGSFVMGSEKITNEKPPHMVTIRSFLIGKTEVTQEQWQAVIGDNPSINKRQDLPVDNVSWERIQQFITKLNLNTGKRYRLPSEAEWEYAARGRTNTDWSFGDDRSELVNYSWYDANSGGRLHPVGQMQPNPFGLRDVHGNAMEWVQDCWHEDYVGAPTDGSAWVTGCKEIFRVVRGGTSYSDASKLRSASRSVTHPRNSLVNYGFRLARDL
jgi:formylglycine-generating enzyme required for sulfatase activity